MTATLPHEASAFCGLRCDSSRRAVDRSCAFTTTGTSPSLHLLGGGKVGRALLRLLAHRPYRLIAMSDRSGTAYDAGGLDARELAELKERGGRIADRAGAERVSARIAAGLVPADIVVDCMATDPCAAGGALARSLAVLDSGRALVLAAKDTLLADPRALLSQGRAVRVGCNAVLGGTGAALCAELGELRARCCEVACVPNATTTCVIEHLECGASLAAGIAAARARGLVEHDAENDLDGTDAAIKLAIVATLLARPGARRVRIEDIARPHVADLDPALVRARRSRGATTRLVGRIPAGGRPPVLAFEELPRTASLAVPSTHVAYGYRLGQSTRVHAGAGIGPEGAAQALLADIVALSAELVR